MPLFDKILPGLFAGRHRRRLAAVIAALVAVAAARFFPHESPGLDGAHVRRGQDAAASAVPDGIGPVPAGRYELVGTVVSVADGDTITLLTDARKQRRIRLDSIDAPEEGHGVSEPGQPHAEASRQHLASLVAGKRITARCYEADQYGRDVCALMLDGDWSANRAQVAAGYAWAYTARRGDYLRDKEMPRLQERARAARLGLWARGEAVPPWKWRYDCWRQQACGQ